MAETVGMGAAPPPGETRRDFLSLTTAAFTAVGVGALAWPFVASMNPAQDVLALSTTEVDLAPIAQGSSITVVWRGRPVFVRHRTPDETRVAREVQLSALPDPQADQSRVKKDDWLVLVGVCTHLGCVPLGQKPTDSRGEYGGWFCPCHGSHYDGAARIRKGPAPLNLPVPDYTFTSPTQIRIG